MVEIMKYEMECLREVGVKLSEISYDNPTDKQMCFAKCVSVKAGFFDQSGKYIEGSAEKKLNFSGEMIEKTKECTTTFKSDPCENVYETLKCVRGKLNLTIQDFIKMLSN